MTNATIIMIYIAAYVIFFGIFIKPKIKNKDGKL